MAYTTTEEIQALIDATRDVGSWQNAVLDKDLTAPPGGPSTGDRYIVASVATGAWAGQEDDIAEWNGTSWDFITPSEGFIVYIDDENSAYTFDGAAWVMGIPGAGGGVSLEDEGTPVTGTPHTTLNFTGAGVTVTDAGSGEATVTIPGGGGTQTVRTVIPFTRESATGGLLTINVTSDTTTAFRQIIFNKANYSLTTRAYLEVRALVQNAGETVFVNFYSMDLQEASPTLITGSEVSHTGDTNWTYLTSGDFWANIPSGDILIEPRARSSTSSASQCGQLDTEDIIFLVLEQDVT